MIEQKNAGHEPDSIPVLSTPVDSFLSQDRFTKETYQALLAAVEALPKEAVEKAEAEVTRKGYNTTGYQYQFLVNVLNDVVGPAGWSFDFEKLMEKEGTFRNGKTYYEITVRIDMDVLGVRRSCVGGHRSEMHADALKGAITNGFKKTVSLYGVGKKAYEGTLDEDYMPVPEMTTGHKCDSRTGCDSIDTRPVPGTNLWACPTHLPTK